MAAAPADAPAQAPRQPSGLRMFVRRLVREKPLGLAGGVILLLFLVCGVLADVIAPYGFNEALEGARLKAPSWAHWFGTDNLGRDVLSRCIEGAQLSVIIGLSSALLATVISAVLGIVSGYFGGKVDMVIQRLVDAWMSFPDLVVLIVVVAVLGPGMPQIVATLGVLLGIAGSRVVRSAVVSVRENTYIHAAQSLGATKAQLIRHVILPSALPDILTGIRIGLGVGWSTLVAAELIAATSGLGFMVQSAAQFLVTDVVVLGILLIALIAFALEMSLRALQRKLVPWHGQSH